MKTYYGCDMFLPIFYFKMVLNITHFRKKEKIFFTKYREQ